MKLTILSVLFLAASLHAQTAKVIPLSPEDAALAKSLADQKAAIVQKMDELQKKITDKYLMEEKPGAATFGYVITCGISSNGLCTPTQTPPAKKGEHHSELKSGWWNFEYSEDFKYIVPRTVTSTITPCTNWTNLTPAGSISY